MFSSPVNKNSLAFLALPRSEDDALRVDDLSAPLNPNDAKVVHDALKGFLQAKSYHQIKAGALVLFAGILVLAIATLPLWAEVPKGVGLGCYLSVIPGFPVALLGGGKMVVAVTTRYAPLREWEYDDARLRLLKSESIAFYQAKEDYKQARALETSWGQLGLVQGDEDL